MKTKRFRKWCAIFIPTLVIIFFFAGFLFAPNDPMKSNLLERYADPSTEYPFGTDALGRCILSRILYGGWTTLGIVLGGSLIVFLLGTVIGMVTSRAVMKENALIDGLINAVTAIPPDCVFNCVYWSLGQRSENYSCRAHCVLHFEIHKTGSYPYRHGNGKSLCHVCNRFRRFKAQNHADSYFPEFDCRNDSLSVPFLCGYDSGYYRIFLYWIRAW